MKWLLGGIIASLLLVAPTVTAQSGSGDVTVIATVPGQPPATAPIIDLPLSGTNLTQRQVNIEGRCQAGLVVKVFRNEIFAGSALCQGNGTFSMQIDVLENKNDIVARQYDLLSQPSPTSETITLFYVSTQPDLSRKSNEQTAHFQLVIDYDYNFQGVFMNEGFNLPIHFVGGTAPYAVSVDWGDGNTKVYSREDTSQFYAEHAFAKPGPYTIKILVSDKDGQQASLQFVLIVNNGPVDTLPLKGSGNENAQENEAQNATLYASLATGGASFTVGFLVASFWDTLRLRIKGGPKIDPPSKM